MAKNYFLQPGSKIILACSSSSLNAFDASNTRKCSLRWKWGTLWIKHELDPVLNLNVLNNNQSLQDCLERSLIKIACIDVSLGESALNMWANACKQAKKKIFVRIPSFSKLPQKKRPFSWLFKRIIDLITAVIFLFLLSPVFGIFILLIRLTFSGSIFFRQWRIGQRGQLFQIIRFRTIFNDAENYCYQEMNTEEIQIHYQCLDNPRINNLGQWMRKYRLDELPQLINVLRGEMSFVGPRPWALYDAIQIQSKDRGILRTLPGITGILSVEKQPTLSDIDRTIHLNHEYLRNWSIWKDTIILMKTILKILSGFIAC
jgi:lipopolysaccharide/colanic/teichoic acid biosynthesis glycosyltransferase